MKNLCLFIILLFLGNLGQAQLRMAVMGGPHSASVMETNNLTGWEMNVKPGFSPRGGLNLGIMADVPLSSSATSGFFLQPGIAYMAKGRKFFMRNDTATSMLTDTISAAHNLSINYIEIPFNIAYKIPLGKKARFVLSAGPYVSFFYNGKQSFETRVYSSNSFKAEERNLETGTGEGKIKTFDAGFNARAGFELGNVLLTGFMSRGLTNFYTAPYEGSFKHKVVGASVGFWLNKRATETKPLKDSDRDGTPDKDDACPGIAGPESTKGCPDMDGDGIADKKDKCPSEAGKLKYEGCPVPDRDGDGLNDEQDACPDKFGVPEFGGCPVPDSDGDGFVDTVDKCPDLPGTEENQGCPVIKQDTVRKVVEEKVNFAARKIFFKANSDLLIEESIAPLDEVAVLLNNYRSYKVVIEGHTDSTGSSHINNILSQKRAETVKIYLMEKGVDASRLTAIGYGAERPLISNSTPAGRAVNRRVEIRLAE